MYSQRPMEHLSVQAVLGLIGAIILVGLAGEWVFNKTSIPSVLILLGLGMALGPGLKLIDPRAILRPASENLRSCAGDQRQLHRDFDVGRSPRGHFSRTRAFPTARKNPRGHGAGDLHGRGLFNADLRQDPGLPGPVGLLKDFTPGGAHRECGIDQSHMGVGLGKIAKLCPRLRQVMLRE